jgi:type I restriction enzyme, S subunit
MRLVELQECCQIINGSTPSRNTKEYWDGDISWFTPKDLSGLESKYIEDSPEFITLEGYNSCSTTMIPAGSLLFTSRAPIGHLAINRKKVCTNQGFKTLVPNEGVDVEYLYYVIKKNVPQLQDLGNGATFKELSKATISKFKIPLPPPEEQKKIAAILDAADDFRQKTKALIDKYDQLTQSLFLDMFGDPVTNPKGWEVKLVKDVAEAKNGYAFKSTDYLESGVPLIRMSNFNNGPVEIKETIKVSDKFLDSKKSFILKNNDFVIALSGATTGKYGIYLHDFPSLLNQRIGLIRAHQNVSVKYLHEFLKLKSDEILKMAAGAAQPNVSLKEIQEITIPIPPENLQQRFSTSLDSIMIQKQQVEASLVKAEELFNSLLQRAFKGELTN